MPGVTFIDMIYRLLSTKGFDTRQVELCNILFQEPIATSESYDSKVRIILEESGDFWKVKAESCKIKDGRTLSSVWSSNYQCEMHINRASRSKSIDIEGLKKGASSVLDMEEAYNYLRKININHYEFMKGLGSVYRGKDYMLAEIHLSELARQYVPSSYIHPAYLDASTIVPSLFIFKQRNYSEEDLAAMNPSIPIYVESFHCPGRLEEKCYVYVREENVTVSHSQDVLYTDIEIYNESGSLAAMFKRFGTKQVRSKELITGLQRIETGQEEAVQRTVPHVAVSETALPKRGVSVADLGLEEAKTAIEEDLRKMVAALQNRNVDEISLEEGYYDQGLDSVQLLELVKELEKKLGQQLYPTLLFEYTNIKELAEYLAEKYAEKYILLQDGGQEKATSVSPVEMPVGKMYLTHRWSRQAVPVGQAPELKGTLLVFENGNDIGAELSAAVERSGSLKVVSVKPGPAFARVGDRLYEINPGCREDYFRLMEGLGADGMIPGYVVHMWSDGNFNENPEEISEMLEKGAFSVLYLSQALMGQKSHDKVYLLYAYPSCVAGGQPQYSAVSGLLKTIRMENRRFMVKAVELCGPLAPGQAARIIFDEFDAGNDTEIRYEGGIRHVKILTGIDVESEVSKAELPLRQEGVYLITGGTGGLGMIFAGYLAEKTKAKLVLAGRSELNTGTEEAIRRLEASGSEVLYIQADIAKLEDVKKLIAAAKERFGRIHGVLHGAGVVRDSLVAVKTREEAECVFAPKIFGTMYLDEVLKDEQLDFFTLFSSTAALAGNVGQSDYACANSFMDYYAAFREDMREKGRRWGKSLSLNWPFWKEGGMKVASSVKEAMKSEMGMYPLSTDSGIKAFEDGLKLSLSSLAVIEGDEEKLKAALGIKKMQPQTLQELPEVEYRDDDIAITGLSGRYPMAATLEEFWENLTAGMDCITEIPAGRWDHNKYYNPDRTVIGASYSKWGGFLEDIDKFDPLFFNISPREAEFMDPQERLFLEIAWQAFEDAGYTRQMLNKGKIGVFVGVMWGQYQLLETAVNGRPVWPTSFYASIANRVSYFFNLHGPSISLDTMCSSSLTSIHLACESIRRGESDAAIAGGVNISIHPGKYIFLSAQNFASSDGRCRSFGEGGDGYVPGEGVGAVVLKPLKKAVADGDRIYAVIKGSSINAGGRTSGFTVPNPNAQANVISDVLKKTGINPRTISYVEAHGTGTSLGDPIEIQGLVKAFREYTNDRQYCSIASVKSNIGHLESAAGIAGLTKVLLQMKYGKIVPSLHAERLNPNISFEETPFFVQRELNDWRCPVINEGGNEVLAPRRAAISAFGAGGANAHMIIEEYIAPGQNTRNIDRGMQMVVLSAKNEERLKVYALNLARFLRRKLSRQDQEELFLQDIAYTLQVGREAFNERLALVVSGIEELVEKLERFANGETGIEGLSRGNVKTGIEKTTGYDRIVHEMELSKDLQSLAELWIKGVEIDWAALYRGYSPRRITLCGYPFERESYWIHTVDKDLNVITTEGTGIPEVPATQYFTCRWQYKDIQSTDRSILNKDMIIFDTENSISGAVMENPGRRGSDSRIILVKQGKEYRNCGSNVYEINPQEQGDYITLLSRLMQDGLQPGALMFLWPLRAGVDAGNILEGAAEEKNITGHLLSKGIIPVFHLIKALTKVKLPSLERLMVFHEGDTKMSDPFMASISAYSRSMSLLWPGFAFTSVEILKSCGNEEELKHVIIRELTAFREEIVPEARYEGLKRYVRKAVPVENKTNCKVSLKKHGIYLITGGAGGLGSVFARYLAEKYGAKLILTGRSPIDEKKRKLIGELEALGSEAVYFSGDTADLLRMKEIIRKANERFGDVNGIIHSAGSMSGKLVSQKETGEFLDMLEAKVQGTIVLDEASKDQPLDFFMMFSSTSSVLGDFGQCDYALGNRFMDNYTYLREYLVDKGLRRGRTMTVNWPLWKDGGMHVNGSNEELYLKTSGMTYLDNKDGVEAFEKILGGSEHQTIVFSGYPSRIRELVDSYNNERKKSSGGQASSSRPAGKGIVRKLRKADCSTDKMPVEQQFEKDLQAMAADLLHVRHDRLDVNENLGDYGFDSISLKTFASNISDVYHIEVSPTVFFQQSAIRGICGHLLEEFGEQVRAYYTENAGDEEEYYEEYELHSEESSGSDAAEGYMSGRGKTQSEPVAVIGIAGVFPGSKDIETFWDNLENQRNLVTEIPPERWDWREFYSTDRQEKNKSVSKWAGFIDDVDKFDARFFNISPREAELMDPQHRIFLEVVWKALEDSGHKPSQLWGRQVGVFTGIQYNDYQKLLEGLGEMQAQMTTGNAHSMLSNRVSFLFNFRGPSESIDTACSSSLVAVNRAVKAIQSGECEMAVAGGVSLALVPGSFIFGSIMGILSPDGKCKAFDKSANGFVKGEGVGAILLKPLSKAVEDHDHIYAVIRGGAENHGGRSSSLTAPNSQAQSEVIISAYEDAGVDPKYISYIETHGTGTELGDPVEIEGLKRAFKEMYARRGLQSPKTAYCGLGSVKTNVGHLEPAAGIVSMIKTILSIEKKKLPGILHLKELNPYISLEDTPFYIVRNTKYWERPKDEDGKELPRTAGVSAFGFGGSNAHIVLQEYEGRLSRKKACDGGNYVIVLSAKNEERLREYAGNLARFVRKTVIGFEAREETGSEIRSGAVCEELIKMASTILGVSESDIDPGEDMEGCGFDHVTLEEFSRKINEEYGLDIAATLFSDYGSIERLADYLYCTAGDRFAAKAHDGKCVVPDNSGGADSKIPCLEDIAYTLQVGREAMEERIALVVSSVGEMADKLELYCQGSTEIENLYKGNIKNNKGRQELLMEGEEGEEFIRAVVEKRKFSKIARLWVSGIEIDWELLYRPCLPQRVSLPSYPFARERYWAPGCGPEAVLRTVMPSRVEGKVKLHPLIDRNTSTLGELKFTTILTGSEPSVAGLRLGTQKVLPCAAYIEMARAAGEIIGEGCVQLLTGLVCTGLVMPGTEGCELYISLCPDGELLGFELGSVESGGDRKVFMQGGLVFEDTCGGPYENIYEDIDSIRANLHSRISGDDCYDVLAGTGMYCGREMRPIREILIGEGEALAEMILPDTLWNTAEDFRLHPVLLEGALQLANLILVKSGSRTGGTYTHFTVGEVAVLGDLPSKCLVYASMDMEEKSFDIHLLDEAGKILVEISDFNIVSQDIPDQEMQDVDGDYLMHLLRKLENKEMDINEADALTEGPYAK
jgi:acyl transferase domain-containing protein/NAD(P)-dependent dehydrogenase (short-subunit alcohol dehydrogenase family)/acyl carrier protein